MLVSPRFLYANSTSHTWLFSAFAELIDNAYDPDVYARELKIDVRHIYGQDCLTFIDNGNGMTPEKLSKMLSFGYSEKTTSHNTKPIGQYGNGFKSGSMRIGKDALVFTRCKTSMSVGMLSQTYLSNIKAETLMVPIVTFDLQSNLLQENPDSLANKEAITKYSIFNSEHQLKLELEEMAKMETGTNIIIYNLKKDESGNYELDFESDKTDIRNPETQMKDITTIERPISQPIPEYERSLREYCSILYLRPRMRIMIRGKKVATKPIRRSLPRAANYYYNPSWLDRKIQLTFGFYENIESENYGMMVYHNNRLIRAYEKVGCQKQSEGLLMWRQVTKIASEQVFRLKKNALGIGVVGVVEANFLEPIHNKQDFKRTEKYSAFMQNVAIKLNNYCNERIEEQNTDTADSSTQLPNWNWVQCDNCDKWRRAPTGYTVDTDKSWYCKQNPDAEYNRCDIREEPEDGEEQQPKNKRKSKRTVRCDIPEEPEDGEAQQSKNKRKSKRTVRCDTPEEPEDGEAQQPKNKRKSKKTVVKKRGHANLKKEISSGQGKTDHATTLGTIEEAQQPISADQDEEKQIQIQQLEVEENGQAISGMTGSLILPTDERTEISSGQGKTDHATTLGTIEEAQQPISADQDEEKQIQIQQLEVEENGQAISGMTGSLILPTDERTEISSGQGKTDHATTLGTIEEAQQPISADQDEEKQIQIQQLEVEENGQAISGMTGSLILPTDERTSLGEKIQEMNGAGSSTVTLCSGSTNGLRAPKRKHDLVNESTKGEEPGKKVVKITERDGVIAVIVQDKDEQTKGLDEEGPSESNSAPDPSKRENSCKPDESCDETFSETKAENDELKEMDDVRPDGEELDEKPTEIVHDKVETYKDEAIKSAIQEEVDLQNLNPDEQKKTLLLQARELRETRKNLRSLQDNILKLLKMIEPDFDHGEPCNIEDKIVDLIRKKGQQETSESQSKADTGE